MESLFGGRQRIIAGLINKSRSVVKYTSSRLSRLAERSFHSYTF